MHDLSWIKPVTALITLAGALLCLRYTICVRHSPPGQQRRLQLFYGSQALLLLGLGMNQYLDLLNRLTSYSRLAAMRAGWYNTRRLAQFDLIVGLGLAAFVGLLFASWYFRPILRRHWLPLATAMGLLTYVAIRTVSLHAVDDIILERVRGVPLDWLFELSGICALIGSLTVAFYQQGSGRKREERPESKD